MSCIEDLHSSIRALKHSTFFLSTPLRSCFASCGLVTYSGQKGRITRNATYVRLCTHNTHVLATGPWSQLHHSFDTLICARTADICYGEYLITVRYVRFCDQSPRRVRVAKALVCQ